MPCNFTRKSSCSLSILCVDNCDYMEIKTGLGEDKFHAMSLPFSVSGNSELTVSWFVGFCSADICENTRCSNGEKCVVSIIQQPSCQCPKEEDCPRDFEPVCGSDNMTYINLCRMRVEACKKGQIILMDKSGVCGKRSTNCLQPSWFMPFSIPSFTSCSLATVTLMQAVGGSCPI